jgi:hypothetical protein
LPIGQLAHFRAHQPVVEEQTGIEIVGEVDQKLQAALFHLDELIALIELAVLRTALAALAGLQRDAFARHVEHFARDAGNLAHAQSCTSAGTSAGARYSWMCR